VWRHILEADDDKCKIKEIIFNDLSLCNMDNLTLIFL
jgi:hypothetical protein